MEHIRGRSHGVLTRFSFSFLLLLIFVNDFGSEVEWAC